MREKRKIERDSTVNNPFDESRPTLNTKASVVKASSARNWFPAHVALQFCLFVTPFSTFGAVLVSSVHAWSAGSSVGRKDFLEMPEGWSYFVRSETRFVFGSRWKIIVLSALKGFLLFQDAKCSVVTGNCLEALEVWGFLVVMRVSKGFPFWKKKFSWKAGKHFWTHVMFS